MIILSVVGVLVALAALVFQQARTTRAVLHKIDDIEHPDSTQVVVQEYDDAWIHTALRDLTFAVDEGVLQVARSERRVRAVVTSAKRRFESEGYEDPGLNAEEETLPLFNAASSQEEGVPPLPNDVESAANYDGTPWAAVPGIERV